VIDLNDAFADGHRSGVLVEELTLASLVQTLATGIPGINRVKILVGGRERALVLSKVLLALDGP